MRTCNRTGNGANAKRVLILAALCTGFNLLASGVATAGPFDNLLNALQAGQQKNPQNVAAQQKTGEGPNANTPSQTVGFLPTANNLDVESSGVLPPKECLSANDFDSNALEKYGHVPIGITYYSFGDTTEDIRRLEQRARPELCRMILRRDEMNVSNYLGAASIAKDDVSRRNPFGRNCLVTSYRKYFAYLDQRFLDDYESYQTSSMSFPGPHEQAESVVQNMLAKCANDLTPTDAATKDPYFGQRYKELTAWEEIRKRAEQQVRGFELKGLGLELKREQLESGWNHLWTCESDISDSRTQHCKILIPHKVCPSGSLRATPCAQRDLVDADVSKLESNTKRFLTLFDLDVGLIEIWFYNGASEKIVFTQTAKQISDLGGIRSAIEGKYGPPTRLLRDDPSEFPDPEWYGKDEMLSLVSLAGRFSGFPVLELTIERPSLVEARKARLADKIDADEQSKAALLKSPRKDL